MTALYFSVFLRAASDVILYAYLPLHLNHVFGTGKFTLISLFLAVPAAVRTVAAPMWGRRAGHVVRGKGTKSTALKTYLLLPLLGYVLILLILPRTQNPAYGLIGIGVLSALTAGFNPVSRTWLALGEDRQGIFRLAVWHQWEGAGYFVSGLLFGLVLYYQSMVLVASATVVAGLIALAMAFIWFYLPGVKTGHQRKIPPLTPAKPPRWSGSQVRPGISQATPSRSGRAAMHSLPLTVIAFHFIAFLFWEAVAGTFSLRWVEGLKGNLTYFGIAISVSTLVAAFSYRPFAHWARRIKSRTGKNSSVFFTAALGYALMYVIMIIPSVFAAGVAYMIPMSSVVRTGTNMLLTEEVIEAKKGEGMGIIEATESAAAVIGFLIGGFSAELFGLSSVPVIALIGCLPLFILSTLVMGYRSRHH